SAEDNNKPVFSDLQFPRQLQQNQCADFFAKLGVSSDADFSVHTTAPKAFMMSS
ncbi:hypothetical protein A2U01_0077837, partial [Trifolium medium]|nr:hypothetical protein [Trifolium medium]